MIGQIINITENVRPEYLSKLKHKTQMIFVEIYKDKRFGAIAKLYERNSLFDRIQEKTTKAERKRFSDAISKAGENDKPLDTSKWVKPDEETIRYALIKSLFFLEIFKEDNGRWQEHYGKAQAFYSLLHDHSPKNPQTLGNWCIDPYFQKIMAEFKSIEHKKYWADFNKDLKVKNKTKKEAKEHWDKRRKDYQRWKKETLKKMIMKDPKPHKFKDIFKDMKVVQKEMKHSSVKKTSKGNKKVKKK